jgi:hypothetical protein
MSFDAIGHYFPSGRGGGGGGGLNLNTDFIDVTLRGILLT